MSHRHNGQGGVVINLSAGAARLGSPNEYVDYAASKGALESFSIGRGGQPEEVTQAILWLAIEEASFITGTFLDVTWGEMSPIISS